MAPAFHHHRIDARMTGQDRVLALQGVHNFRDYGGYVVAGGGRVRRGVLWRSGQHGAATDDDLAVIDRIGLQVVYDLRSGVERQLAPCRRPAGFTGRLVAIDADTRGLATPAPETSEADTPAPAAPHVAAVSSRRRDAASTREALRGSYRNLPFRTSLLAMMRLYLAGLARDDGASLINCMAGKDRTGMAVAMLHSALGVHHDDIMADYLLTNSAGDVEARIAAGGEAIRATIGELEPDVLRAMMGVEAEYLETAFAAIREQHGTQDAFLEQALGVDPAMRTALRARLVEG